MYFSHQHTLLMQMRRVTVQTSPNDRYMISFLTKLNQFLLHEDEETESNSATLNLNLLLTRFRSESVTMVTDWGRVTSVSETSSVEPSGSGLSNLSFWTEKPESRFQHPLKRTPGICQKHHFYGGLHICWGVLSFIYLFYWMFVQ